MQPMRRLVVEERGADMFGLQTPANQRRGGTQAGIVHQNLGGSAARRKGPHTSTQSFTEAFTTTRDPRGLNQKKLKTHQRCPSKATSDASFSAFCFISTPGCTGRRLREATLTRLRVHREVLLALHQRVHQLGAVSISRVVGVRRRHLDYRRA